MMKKAFDTQDSKCESSGKFTEPRQKEVSGSFDSALDEFVDRVRDWYPMCEGWGTRASRIDEAVLDMRFHNPSVWEEAIKDPRVTGQPFKTGDIVYPIGHPDGPMEPFRIGYVSSNTPPEPLSIKSISKQVETHKSAKRHSWWNT